MEKVAIMDYPICEGEFGREGGIVIFRLFVFDRLMSSMACTFIVRTVFAISITEN